MGKMGVDWVFQTFRSARSIELIFKHSGAVLRGPEKSFRDDCVWYRPRNEVASLISGFYLLHHSIFPDSAFIINANKPPTSQPQQRFPPIPPRAAADRGFELQLYKFQSAGLTADTVNKFEVVGNEYELTDFRLRVGNVSRVSFLSWNSRPQTLWSCANNCSLKGRATVIIWPRKDDQDCEERKFNKLFYLPCKFYSFLKQKNSFFNKFSSFQKAWLVTFCFSNFNN